MFALEAKLFNNIIKLLSTLPAQLAIQSLRKFLAKWKGFTIVNEKAL